MLVTCLAWPAQQRRLLDGRWVGLAGGVFAASWLAALDREAALEHGGTWLAAALLFALARRTAPGERAVTALAAGIALAALPALAQAAGGLAQLAGGVDTLPPGMREAAAARLASGRAFGTAALPGHFAALQLMVLPLLLGAAGRVRGAGRGAFGALALLAVAGLAVTRSLAVVGVAAVLLAVAVLRRRGGVVAAGGALTLLVLGVATALWRGDVASLEPVRLRLVNWQAALTALVAHPWLGVGLGGVGQANLAGRWGAINMTPYTHNTYLQLLAELGVAGAGLVAVGLGGLARLLARGVRQELPLTLAVLVLPLHNLVDFSAYAPEVVLPWATLAGTLAARTGLPLPRPTSPPLLLLLLGGGLFLSTLSFLAEQRLHQAVAEDHPGPALAAARLTPWAVAPVLTAAELALLNPTAVSMHTEILNALAQREWVRPASAAVAEARARLLLGLGRRGEAAAWAGEARRRAPWRGELGELEAACAGPP